MPLQIFFLINIDVIFMEDDTSVGNALEMHLSGRNKSPTTIVMDKFSKSSSCDNDEDRKEKI